ncbi:G5 domain-containing protein [Candidatus Saccharibacteria bacterium]|nr:G5 domain-containing protein [Candidatus Saccharibacteria bacterium]
MVWRYTIIIILSLVAVVTVSMNVPVQAQETGKKLITVYDRELVRVFLTDEKILGDALKAEDIEIDAHDFVEPSIDQELIAPDYKVNIYRARPVVVVDGETRVKTISAYQTPRQIAKDVKIVIYDEDTTSLHPSTDFVNDGAGLVLTINRSLVINLDLYGKVTTVRTQAKTVGDMLTEKKIVLGINGRVTPSVDTRLTTNLAVRVWREGKQTITIDQLIPVASQIVYDADRPIGYRAVKSEGSPGNRSISYQIDVRDGIEISRQEIANIVTKPPTDTIEVIGIRNDGRGLTESKGAQYYTDSKGVSHRETYYDLNMSVVMQSCGQGGRYSVRPDGAKVDAQGYIIVAANYSNYPKCSLVETSLGTAKVYDTGGFALRHPFGFDLATDWTRSDGI